MGELRTLIKSKIKKATSDETIILGVCASLAKTFDVDVTLVRLLTGIMFIFWTIQTIVCYFLIAVFLTFGEKLFGPGIFEEDNTSNSEVVSEKEKIDPNKVKEAEEAVVVEPVTGVDKEQPLEKDKNIDKNIDNE